LGGRGGKKEIFISKEKFPLLLGEPCRENKKGSSTKKNRGGEYLLSVQKGGGKKGLFSRGEGFKLAHSRKYSK